MINITINEIKKVIREIEISYDYNHSKNDYDVVLNLTKLANLIKTLQDKTIDEFLTEICKMIVQSENNGNYRFYAVEIKQAIADLAEQLKTNNKK